MQNNVFSISSLELVSQVTFPGKCCTPHIACVPETFIQHVYQSVQHNLVTDNEIVFSATIVRHVNILGPIKKALIPQNFYTTKKYNFAYCSRTAAFVSFYISNIFKDFKNMIVYLCLKFQQ